MTEEKAKTKQCCGPEWCGETIDTGHRTGASMDGNPIYRRMCIGSACMAWRKMPVTDDWGTAIRDFIKNDKLINAIRTYRMATGATLKEAKDACEEMRDGKRPFLQLAGKDDGYCGLAGAP